MSYIVEVFAGIQLTHIRIQPGSESLLEANLHFTIGRDIDQPLQIRVWNERAAFDGRLALGSVTMIPQRQIRDETRDYFTAALSQ